jgi:hypothetical protein
VIPQGVHRRLNRGSDSERSRENGRARVPIVLGAGGTASRWTLFIGSDGRILDIDKGVNASSHGRAIVEKLTELGI